MQKTKDIFPPEGAGAIIIGFPMSSPAINIIIHSNGGQSWRGPPNVLSNSFLSLVTSGVGAGPDLVVLFFEQGKEHGSSWLVRWQG